MSADTWTTVVRKNTLNTSNTLNTLKTSSFKTTIANTSKENESNENEPLIKKNTKSLDSTKRRTLIEFRSLDKLTQKDIARNLNIKLFDIQDAEVGKEINMKSYHAINRYIEKKNLSNATNSI